MIRALLTLSFFALSACSTTEKNNQHLRPILNLTALEDESVEDKKDQQKTTEKMSAKETKIVKIAKAQLAKKAAKKYTYKLRPKRINAQIKKWIRYYTKKDRKRFQKFLNRGAQYKELVQKLLVEHGLPPDLYYLGILESGYRTNAISHAGAVGTWQFMRGTGKQYGLGIHGYADERLDPIRSTMAAIRYLKELYRQTKSWELAMAAYNAGPGRIRRAIRRGGSKNYWNLSRRRFLPYDTRQYIPQFLAILTIGTNLKKYGFHERATQTLPDIRLVKVPSPVRLKDIARLTKIPLSKIKKHNAHLTKGVTPPHLKTYHVWVPKKKISSVIAKRAALAKRKVKGLKRRRYIAKRKRSRYHTVRRGQTLSQISRRYGRSIASIKRANGMRSSKIFVGQKLRLSGKSRRIAKMKRTRKKVRYKIRRGDNLTTIARKFKTTVRNIKNLNKIRGSRIMKGQILSIAVN